uniref:Nucleoside phosphorylase n=1 Tax=Staphylothermus marinus TaxID=2280 RepID=A0A7C4D841_STAMA
MPYHIKASAGDIAENVIAVGDPGRAELLSKLLDDVVLVNSNRGLLVYTGLYKDGRVTIATHGIGSSSALIVFEELAMLGAKRIVRLGSAGGLRRDLEIGDVVVATTAYYPAGGCGLQQYLNNNCGATAPNPLLITSIIRELAGNRIKYVMGPVYSSDAFYAESKDFVEKMSKLGVLAVEMETAALYTLGWIRGFETASILVISNNLITGVVVDSFDLLKNRFVEIARVILEVFSRGVEKI